MTDIECIVQSRDRLGESPLWCARTGRLWWVDILRPSLQFYDPATGEHRIERVPAKTLGSIALRASGGFVLATERGLLGFEPGRSEATPLVELEPDRPGNRLNDGKCDRRGRFWVGSMDAAERDATGALYRVEPDGRAARLLDGIAIPNSLAFDLDDRRLFFADTRRFAIWTFDLDLASGAISNRRVFADLAARRGRPDGSCVDAEGFLWNAEYAGGRIVRYAPDGRVDRVVELPVSCPTCCAFGGERLDCLYVTSASFALDAAQRAAEPEAGSLFRLEVGVRGVPEPMFGG